MQGRQVDDMGIEGATTSQSAVDQMWMASKTSGPNLRRRSGAFHFVISVEKCATADNHNNGAISGLDRRSHATDSGKDIQHDGFYNSLELAKYPTLG